MIDNTTQMTFGSQGEQIFQDWLISHNKQFTYYDWNTPEGKQFQLRHIDFLVERLGYCDVKYDSRIAYTGNFYLEYRQYCLDTQTYGSSALYDSEADCIVYISSSDNRCWILDGLKVRQYCQSHDLRTASASDGNIFTEGYLLSVQCAEDEGLIRHKGYLII